MKRSHVVGAGIVGLATALYLQEKGRAVSMFDPLPPGEGTSSGNAGIISTGSLFPEAEPGIWKQFPGMILDPLAPVCVRPGSLPGLLPWLLRFLSRSSQQKFESGTRSIAPLSTRALEFLDPLVKKAEAETLLRREGIIYVYAEVGQFQKAQTRCQLRDRLGSDYRIVEGRELRDLLPCLRDGLAGGIVIPSAAFTVSPLALSRKLFDLFKSQGGEYLQGEVSGFDTVGQSCKAIKANGDSHPGDEIFITAGAYSGALARQLGSKVPLVTERGYHLMLPNPELTVDGSLILVEKGLAVTPMLDGLRLAGTVELAALDEPANYKRAWKLAQYAEELLPGLNTEGGEPWMGYRPSVPDSVPVISRSPNYDNVFYGFGHGHLGLTQAAITGAMLAAMAEGVNPPEPGHSYRIDRSWW
ncbi:MAG: FAD-binding oxidoreductase [Gammaproteobacteria bacterium]|nr:FAD-binding oxidoreductase [Gammaproteobacteria bacterium]